MALDPARYAELFRTESQDQLAAINRALLTLEAEQDATAAAAAVAEIFRAVHTVKGMSATMGYQAVAEFAHELESLLDRMRGEGRRPAPSVTDALFGAVDALEAGVAEASETAARSPAMEAALGRLTVAFNQPDAGELLIRPRNARAHLTRATPELTAFAATETHEVPATGAPTNALAPGADAEQDPFHGPGVIIRIRQAATTQLPGVRAFMLHRALSAIGQVAATSPALEVLQAAVAPAAFAVRLVTQASEAEIEAVVRGVGDVDTVQVDMQGRTRRRAPVEESVTESTSMRARQVRIDVSRLDTLMNLAGELTIARGRLLQLTAGNPDPALDETVQQIAALVGELQREVTASRMVPVGQVFDRFPRMVRDVARALGKDVAFAVEGRDIELDRSLIDEIGEPVVHLLRNAVDHGLEGAAERVAAGKPAQGRLELSEIGRAHV